MTWNSTTENPLPWQYFRWKWVWSWPFLHQPLCHPLHDRPETCKHGNMGCEFSREGYKVFEPKINTLKGNYFSLWNDIVLSCQKNQTFKLIFETLYVLKWCPIFDDSTPCQFTKYNNFFWGYWFLPKNLGVCIPPLKTRQPILP